MAKPKKQEVISATYDEVIEDVTLEGALAERFNEYAVAVIKSRVIPSIEDGLLPVMRRVLYSLSEGDTQTPKKAAKYVGDVLAKYHPHGDASVYGSMLGLGQDHNKLNPFVFIQGNSGSVADESFAAMRYTEAKISRFAIDTLFQDLGKNYIKFKPNFDGTEMEPVVLPSVYPNILNSGVQAIGSGFVSDYMPHRVQDICNITVKLIENPDIEIDELVKDFRPDFPMGGQITNEAELPTFYKNGQGVITLEATIDIETIKGKEVVVIKDLPYKVKTLHILEKIKEILIDDSKLGKDKSPILLDKLADFKDDSDKKTPVRLILIPKKDVSPEVLKNIMLENTRLRSSVKYNANLLSNGVFMENVDIKTMLQLWLDSRISVLTRRYNYEIKSKNEDLALKRALFKAQGKIDEVIKTIKSGKDKENIIAKLRSLLGLAYKEAKYIAEIELYRIAKFEVTKLKDEIVSISAVIDELIATVSNRDNILRIIVSQLNGLASKYKNERRTVLLNSKASSFDVRSVIESKDLVIAISQDNYVYAKAVDEMREYAARGAKGSSFIEPKYKRVVRDMFTVNSHDDLFCFTNTGKVIEMKGYELDLWNKPIGTAIPDLGGQEVVAVIKANLKDDAEKHFVFITAKSLMKRVEVPIMVSQRKMQGGNIAIRINEGDYLVGVALLGSEEDRIVITSNLGRAQNLVASNIAAMLRPTSGYPRATMKDDEYIQCLTTIPAADLETANILIATTKGIGKVVGLDQLPERRGESGRRALIKIVTLKEGDSLLCGKLVKEDSSVVATTKTNKSNKISSSLINKSGRTAKGVKLVTLVDDDVLIDIAVV